MLTIEIRQFQDSDWPAVGAILKATIETGEAYAFAPDSTEDWIRNVWTELPSATFVACGPNGEVLGTYYIKPNQPGLGSHVCNCGYAVSSEAQGKGIASLMCEHSQSTALEMGFRAMQFNFVVSSNERAVRLWERMGFAVVGRLPGAFHHHRLGYVDAFVMFKTLVV